MNKANNEIKSSKNLVRSSEVHIPTNDTKSHQSTAFSDMVDRLKESNPDMYKKCQIQGAFIMKNLPTNETGVDVEGETMVVNNLVKTINEYDMAPEDLDDFDKDLLISKFGDDWYNQIKFVNL